MSNRVRYFGNVRSAAQWAADFGRGPHIGVMFPAKLDPNAFIDGNAIKVIVGAAGAAANATSIPVDAITLPNPAGNILIQGAQRLIPAGTSLYFGASKKLALLTADAKVGDTAVTVQALPTALVDNDTAFYSPYGTKTIASGTVIGRTYAERDASTPFGAGAPSDDELYLLLNDIPDANLPGGDDCEVYRHGLVVKENYLPQYADALSVLYDEVQAVAFGGTSTAGTFRLGVRDPDQEEGNVVWTDAIAWNATNATIIAGINTALDALVGAGQIVATDNGGSAANPNFLLTYSGSNYDDLAQPLAQVDISALTGATTADVDRSVAGGTSLLTQLRKLYTCIKGVD